MKSQSQSEPTRPGSQDTALAEERRRSGDSPAPEGTGQVSQLWERRLEVPEKVLFRDVQGEAVLLHLDTGHYFGLDPVGTEMWSQISRHGQLRPVHEHLLRLYEVNGEELARDLLALVRELLEHGLLVLGAELPDVEAKRDPEVLPASKNSTKEPL